MKIAVGISGASGVIYGVRLLQALKDTPNSVSLVMSEWAKKTLEIETPYTQTMIRELCECCYENDDLSAAVSSGSYGTEATIIAPCSMKTLACIANGISDHLLVRMADVALKERRPLVLMPRETPLSAIHLQNMLTVTQSGGILVPPMPAFYHNPKTINDVIDHSIGKVLDVLRIPHDLYRRWESPQ